MHQDVAARVVEGIKGRFPDAQIVGGGGGFISVHWTDEFEGELCSFVFGDGNGDFGVEVYRGDCLRDAEVARAWAYEFGDLPIDEIIQVLLKPGG